MHRTLSAAAAALCLIPLSAAAADNMTPGLYEYQIKMSMQGAPALPTQTVQHCLSPKDVAGNGAFQMPQRPDTDCKINDMKQSGGQFAYRMACTKPQKLDGTVKGSFTPTSMNMEMNMLVAGAPGAMTQAISARRVGDCKQ